jgi:hypothetical protein
MFAVIRSNLKNVTINFFEMTSDQKEEIKGIY